MLRVSQFLLLISSMYLKVSSRIPRTFSTTYVGLQDDNNFGHSGYAYLSSDTAKPELELSSCQYVDVNITTCQVQFAKFRKRGDVFAIRAWGAATIRDNILAFVSYLLHQTTHKFSDDAESSLIIIYEEIRKNNLRIMDFLPLTNNIPRLHGAGQFAKLFLNLQYIMPLFCKSALQVLANTMLKLKESEDKYNQDDIYIHSENNVKIKFHEIDIYADIGLHILPLLRITYAGKDFHVDKHVNKSLGHEFAIMFVMIQRGKLPLTQPILAALLINMRFDDLSPRESEDLKFLIDILRNNKVNKWSPNFIGSSHLDNPYDLVESTFKSIANHPDVNALLSDIANDLQNRVHSTPHTHETKLMEPFFNTEELNITLLFEVTKSSLPTNTNVKRLQELVENGTINMFYALKGFVRYNYNTPKNLIIAFFQRLKMRAPSHPNTMFLLNQIVDELSDPEIQVRVHSHHYRKNSSRRDYSSRRDLHKLIHSKNKYVKFRPPLIQMFRQKFKKIETNVTVRLDDSPSNSTVNCEEVSKPPLESWLKNLDYPIRNVNLTDLIADASIFLAKFINDNTEISNFMIDLLIKRKIEREHFLKSEVILSNITYEGTARDLLKYLFKKVININKVRARSLIYYDMIKIYCRLINEHENVIFDTSSLKLDELARNNSIELFRSTVSPSLQRVIDSYNASNHSAIYWNNYTTNRQLISDLCRVYLLQPPVKEDDTLFNELLIILHTIYHVPIKFTELLNIYDFKTLYEIKDLRMIQELLMKPDVMQLLGDDFDLGRYPYKGVMLKEILNRLIAYNDIRKNVTLLKVVELQISDITCDGHWAEPVTEILSDVLTDQVDINKIFDLGLDSRKLTPEVQNAFIDMWNWYGGMFNPITYMKEMNISDYATRSQFIEGFLTSLGKNVESDFLRVVRDIKLMRSAILKTGNGLEPVDYL
ncbi:uncharacterized protein LOC130667514 [Microplitis mediator]|uniref:uncharacterized protein LOC130667514 n=1 Tax=Microplitis mediator TaxID=375433 RepID=UPI002552402C|nr:uncharacterized protein LOC130667514 [Microplitis mediator]